MSKIKDLTGVKFGRLTCIGGTRVVNKSTYFDFRCECGAVKSLSISNVKRGTTTSCGCYSREWRTKHGGSTRSFKDRRYEIAAGILKRCNNKNSSNYNRYGGRGIKCNLGESSGDVYQSLLRVEGYFEGAQIDRINNNGHYEIENIRWVAPRENVINSTTCKPKEYYESFPVLRSHFKNICRDRGWDFREFEEKFYEWYVPPKGNRQRKYVYIFKK